MKKWFVLLMLFTSTQVLGESLTSCFYDHVQDAIELNRERRELYSSETEGKSEKISRYLIIWEKLIRIKAKSFDKKARKFQELNIPVMCEDFVDMSETPSYTPRTTQIPRAYIEKLEPNKRDIKKRLRSKLKLGYEPFKAQVINEISKIKENLSYDCLLRHLLESLLRTADLAPRYIQKAPEDEKVKLDKFLKKYLRLQIFGIGQAIFIDRKARELQSVGVPILCNDVPAVHLSPWE